MKIRINRGFRRVLSVLVTLMLLVGVMPLSAVQVHATTFTVYFAKDKLFSSRYYSGSVYISADGSVPVQMTYFDNSNETYGYHIYKYDFASTPGKIRFSTYTDNVWATENITGSNLHDGYVYYTDYQDSGSSSMRALHTTLSTLSDELAATTYTLYCAADMASGGCSGWIETKDTNGWRQMDYLGVLCGFNIDRIRLNYTPECLTLGGSVNTETIYPPNIKDNYLYYCKIEDNVRKVQSFPYEDLTYGALTINQCNMGKDVNVIVDNSETFVPKNERHYVKATMYDYFSDYELLKGRTRTGGNGADVVNGGITVPYGTAWEDPCRRMQHPTFDTQLSGYYRESTAATHPLYFGDIHDEGGGYYFSTYNNNQWHLYYNNLTNGTIINGNVHNEYQQLYHDNNSTRRSGLNVTNQGSSAFAAATGLYADTLSAYNKSAPNTTNAARLRLIDGKDAKWFDSTWLENGLGTSENKKSIGASYDVDFPFWTINMQRKIGSQIYQACDYYYINSEKKEHALRMHKGADERYYLKETGQGIYNYSGNDYNILHENSSAALTSTYGFFPFNSKQDFYTGGTWGDSDKSQDINKDLGGIMDPPLRLDRTNYCFGTYMVIPFKLTNDKGTVNGTTDADDPPITFTFSGDDDLLVYVDGNLVLDIGGNHGKVQGEINFKEKKSWVSNVKNSTGTDASGITWKDNDDTSVTGANLKTGLQVMTSTPTNGNFVKYLTDIKMVSDQNKNIYDAGEHVMEIFYVERGLFDSNMEIMYNLPVIYNRQIEVEKQVESTLNSKITSATNGSNITANLKNLVFPVEMTMSTDQSTWNAPSTPNQYSITGGNQNVSFTSSNQMLIKHGQTTSYQKEFAQPAYLKIQELGTSNLKVGSTDLTKKVSDLFNTSWQYFPNKSVTSGSGNVYSGNNSTGPAQDGTNTGYFQWVGTDTKPSKVKFTNTLKTGTLTLKKTISGAAPATEQTFKFKVTLNNVGGIGLEESAFTGSDGASGGDKIEFTETITIAAGSTTKSVSITGIPLYTSYTVEEVNVPLGYTSSNLVSGTISATISEAAITNTPQQVQSTVFKIRVQSYFTQSNSEQENGVPSSIRLKLQKSTDSGSNWVDQVSDVTISQVSADENGRKYFEFLLPDAYDFNPTDMYRIQEYDSNDTLISTGGYSSVFTVLSGEFTNNTDSKKFSRAVSEAVNEEISGKQVPVLTLSLLNAGPVPVAIKVQKVWGTTTVFPQSVKFKLERSVDGSSWTTIDSVIVGFDGSALTADNEGRIILTETQAVTVKNGDVSNTVWGAYVFNTDNKDIDNNGNVYLYRITEYTSNGTEVPDGSIFYFNNNGSSVMFTAGYRPAAFAPGYQNSYNNGTETTAITLPQGSTVNLTNYGGDENGENVRIVPLAIINSPIPDPDMPETGRRGINMPIMFGLAVILVAAAGYFVYRRKIAL